MDVEVGVKNARFRSGLEECRTHARKFSADLGKMFASSLGGIGTALSVGGLTASFSKILSQTHEIKHASEQFGISAQSMQRVANGMAHGNIEKVAPVLNKMVISQERAREGNKKLAASFDVLGISQQELDSLSPDELLYRIADGTKNAADRGAAYNAVVSILGKTAGDFFHKLEKGSDVLKANGDAMGVYSDRAVKTFADLRKQVFALKSQALPILAEFTSKIVELVGKSWSIRGAFLGAVKVGVTGGGKEGMNAYLEEWKKGYDKRYGTKSDDHVKHPTGNHAEGYSGDGDEPAIGGESESGESRIAALREKKAKLESDAYEKNLSAEQLITELKERQARLTEDAAEARKGGDKEEALKKEVEAVETGKKAGDERARVNREVAATAERIAAIERESRLSNLTAAARILALEKERENLLRKANLDRLGGDTPGAEKKRLEAAEKTREIDREKKALKADALKGIGSGAEKSTKQGDQDEEDENQIKGLQKQARERQTARLSPEQQRAFRTAEKVGIDAEKVGVQAQMTAETDPDKKRGLRKRLAELSLASEEKADQIADLAPKKESKRVSVSADSLQRVGGGGGVFGPSMDPMLRRADTTNDLLRKILAAQEPQGASSGTSRREY